MDILSLKRHYKKSYKSQRIAALCIVLIKKKSKNRHIYNMLLQYQAIFQGDNSFREDKD